jgi:hypothetical protein
MQVEQDPFSGHPLQRHSLSENQAHASSSGMAEASECLYHVHDTSPNKCSQLDIPTLPAAKSTTSGIGRPSPTNMLAAGAHGDLFALTNVCSLGLCG